jgi:hypothetical protein
MSEEIETYRKELITEISLARVFSHVEKRPFALLTAFRGSNSLSVNRGLNKKLENDIRAAGFGFEKVVGTYEEDLGDGKKRRVTEESFMIIGDDDSATKSGAIKGFAKKMGAKYEQDAIFFKSPASPQGLVIGTKAEAWPGLGKEEPVGEFKPNRLNGIYTALKTKNKEPISGFKFEEFHHPMTVTEIWVKHLMKKKGLDNDRQNERTSSSP